MTLELFKKIADELTLFPEDIKKVKIGLHGEPTLHPGLSEMIKYLKRTNCVNVIELFTNGVLLNKHLSWDLIDSGLDRINVSIEALDAKGYKEMTGTKVYMGRLLENLKYLYNIRGDCIIHIKTTGQTDKERFYDMFGDIADEVFVENIVPQWADIERGELKEGMFGQKVKDWKEVCPFVFMYLHFNYDGIVSPCTLDWAREVVIGDATKETPQQIWNGSKLKNLQIAMLEGKRNLINYCDKCLAPMVCVEEDLDKDAKQLLERIR